MNDTNSEPEYQPFQIEGTVLVKLLDTTLRRVVVPEGVTKIAKEAFYQGQFLQKVQLPHGLTEIDDLAFGQCLHLREISLPQTLKKIGEGSFSRCNRLRHISLPDNLVEIGDFAFERCSNLREISIPNGITSLSTEIFFDCEKLSKVDLPQGLLFIGNFAFKGCSSLTEICLPQSLQYVGAEFVKNCRQLKVIEGGNHYTKVEKNAFRMQQVYDFIESYFLITIENQEQQYAYCESRYEYLSQSKQKELISMIHQNEILRGNLLRGKNPLLIRDILFKLPLPPLSLLTLEDYLEHSIQSGQGSITAIFLEYQKNHYSSQDLENHQDRQFQVEIGLLIPTLEEFCKKWHCTLENQMLHIHHYIGSNQAEVVPKVLADGIKINSFCNHKKRMNYPECVLRELEIEADLSGFYLESLPESIKSLHFTGKVDKFQRFRFMKYLEHITMPSSPRLIHITSTTFEDNRQLQSITLSDSVTSIGDWSFSNFRCLKKIQLPDSLCSIGKSVFYNCSALEEINVPDSVITIGQSAFLNCTALTSIEIPHSVTVLEDSTFQYCSNLREIHMADSVRVLGASVFHSCRSLTHFSASETMLEIGLNAFASCKSLQELHIPEQVSIAYSIAYDCPQLVDEHGFLILGNIVNQYQGSASEVEIPEGVTQIGALAFFNCKHIQTLTLPDSLCEIGEQAFSQCHILTKINIPNSVKRIPKGCFSHCKKLEEVILSDSLLDIQDNAFEYCHSISEFHLPDSIKSIGHRAFSHCNKIKQITLPASLDKNGNELFLGCSSLVELTLPETTWKIDVKRALSGLTNDITISANSDSHWETFCANNGYQFQVVE